MALKARRSPCLYAWCPCGAEDTVYEPDGGPLREETLERFAKKHDGHEGARYCDMRGILMDFPPPWVLPNT